MTPKQKADELVEKFLPVALNNEFGKSESQAQLDNAKQCALIAVEEILQELNLLHKPHYTLFEHSDGSCEDGTDRAEFWQQVKQEINGK